MWCLLIFLCIYIFFWIWIALYLYSHIFILDPYLNNFDIKKILKIQGYLTSSLVHTRIFLVILKINYFMFYFSILFTSTWMFLNKIKYQAWCNKEWNSITIAFGSSYLPFLELRCNFYLPFKMSNHCLISSYEHDLNCIYLMSGWLYLNMINK